MRAAAVLIPLLLLTLAAPALAAGDDAQVWSNISVLTIGDIITFYAGSETHVDTWPMDYTAPDGKAVWAFSMFLTDPGTYSGDITFADGTVFPLTVTRTIPLYITGYDSKLNLDGKWHNTTSILPGSQLVTISPGYVASSAGNVPYLTEGDPSWFAEGGIIIPLSKSLTANPIKRVRVSGGSGTATLAVLTYDQVANTEKKVVNKDTPIDGIIKFGTGVYDLLGVVYILITWLTIKGALLMFVVGFELYDFGWRLSSKKTVFAAYSAFMKDNVTLWTFVYAVVYWAAQSLWAFLQMINPLKYII